MSNPNQSQAGNDLIYNIGKLSGASGIPINESNTIKVFSKNASGLIKNLWFEEGFSIRYFNFSVKDDLEFEWFSQHNSDHLVYKLLYILEPPEKNTLGFKNNFPLGS